MKFAGTSKIVLLLLFEASKSLHIYTVYKRSKAPMSEIISVVNRLSDAGLLEIVDDEFLKLTDYGYESALKLGIERQEKSNKPWRKIPERFEVDQEAKDLDFYVPKISLLEKGFIS